MFVQAIIERVKPWWVERVLEVVRADTRFRDEDFELAVSLFRNVLREKASGPLLPHHRNRGGDFDFPIQPQIDGEPWLGVWNPDELEFIRLLLQESKEAQREDFPSQRNLPNDEDGAAWDEWVSEVAEQFAQVENLGIDRPYAVSFIW